MAQLKRDIVDSTREQHRIQLDKLIPLTSRDHVDGLTAADYDQVVATLHG